jgi:hypothetical protein
MPKPANPDPYEPTDDDREFARNVLDRVDVLDIHYVLGTVEGCLNPGELLGGDPLPITAVEIRRARALLSEWRKRQRGSVES